MCNAHLMAVMVLQIFQRSPGRHQCAESPLPCWTPWWVQSVSQRGRTDLPDRAASAPRSSRTRARAHAHPRSSFTCWTLVCYLKFRLKPDCIHYKDGGGSGKHCSNNQRIEGQSWVNPPQVAHTVLFCYTQGQKRQSSWFYSRFPPR